MNDERLSELKEKYKDRNLLEELAWGIYANHSGYTSKQNGEFLNWLCLMAYRSLKERPQGEWIETDELWETDCCGGMGYDYGYYFKCSACGKKVIDKTNFCSECGATMQNGGKEE